MSTSNQSIIRLSRVVVDNPAWRLKAPIDFALNEGENIAIVGRNGNGKSLLVSTIIGNYSLRSGEVEYSFHGADSRHVYDNIQYLAFHDTYGVADYYQQRWNSSEYYDSPTVRNSFGVACDDHYLGELIDKLHIGEVVEKRLLLLSNGELRKFQIIKSLLTKPRVLILDNPFIGLDVESRDSLEGLLNDLSTNLQLSVIIVSSQLTYLPGFVTHVVVVEDMKCMPRINRDEYLKQRSAISLFEEDKIQITRVNELINGSDTTLEGEALSLRDITIKYGDSVILDHINWRVMVGEKWALLGRNGAGKTTLLSLICADNPFAYACDITLFGRKRGTGESIWDIKRRIGYLSPEMHRTYLKDYTALEVVASGFTDYIGAFVTPTEEQLSVCSFWMEVFGVTALKERSFLRMSSGEQRLVLLTRAFVKDPDLLVLDEPLHGLDSYNKLKVRAIIDAFCHRQSKTLIMVTHYEEDLPTTVSQAFRL